MELECACCLLSPGENFPFLFMGALAVNNNLIEVEQSGKGDGGKRGD
jgi:hypothetical protein